MNGPNSDPYYIGVAPGVFALVAVVVVVAVCILCIVCACVPLREASDGSNEEGAQSGATSGYNLY